MRERLHHLVARGGLRLPFRRSGSQTLAKTVAQGISVGSWKTKPISGCAAAGGVELGGRPVDRAGGRLAEAGDDPKHRRLAAAGRAEQADELAAADVERHVLQRQRAVREGLGDRRGARPAACPPVGARVFSASAGAVDRAASGVGARECLPLMSYPTAGAIRRRPRPPDCFEVAELTSPAPCRGPCRRTRSCRPSTDRDRP